MAENSNFTKAYCTKNIIMLFANESENLTLNAEKIRVSTKGIIQSCDKPGTNGDVQKALLLARVKNLKKLASLYDSASKRFLDAANKLRNGGPVDKVMTEMKIYNIFFLDQLKCAEEDVQQVLNDFLANLIR